MKNIVYHFYPEKEQKLGPGPWLDEPDKLQWKDEETGYPCLAVRNHFGTWCGYVGVPHDHLCYGKGYDDVDVDVHGGLTFAGRCNAGADERKSICHVVEDGEDDDVWWLGFDCNHGLDISPLMLQKEKTEWSKEPDWPGSVYEHSIYRDLQYVRKEITSLAQQLRDKGYEGGQDSKSVQWADKS